jgi:predicted DNA-binding protein with PD1-like motif
MEHREVDGGYVVRLVRGEEIVSSLAEFAVNVNLKSGFVIGLGAIRDVELGYYDVEEREYVRKVFEGDFELINMTGNFAMLDGRPFLHAHMTIADSGCHPYAGHVFTATVAVTGEFFVMSTGREISRKPDDETGLNLLSL